MESKLYSDTIDLKGITEKECVIIMKDALKSTHNINDNNRVKMLSYTQINCSNGWLDMFLTLHYIDKEVMMNIIDIIDGGPPRTFIKLSLIIQVLMTYSECRDINRLLLSIFFDKGHFGKTNELFTIMNGKRVKCYSSFCGYQNLHCMTSMYDIMMRSCNYICNMIINDNNDKIYSEITYNMYTIKIVRVKFTYFVFIKTDDEYDSIAILINDHDYVVRDISYNVIDFAHQKKVELNYFLDGVGLSGLRLVHNVTMSLGLLDMKFRKRHILSTWIGDNISNVVY